MPEGPINSNFGSGPAEIVNGVVTEGGAATGPVSLVIASTGGGATFQQHDPPTLFGDWKSAFTDSVPTDLSPPVIGMRGTNVWMVSDGGAFPGVDMIVSHAYSGALGMDQYVIGQELPQELPGADIELTHPGVVFSAALGSVTPAPALSTVISAALSRVGAPYLWGGSGPSSFACSGLVGWAFAREGISTPRTAAQQYLTGPSLTLAQAQPGDLLFWHYDPTDQTFVDHVALYLGDGMMVVAPHTGTEVQVAPAPTADFAGAVQVDPSVAAQVGGARFP